MNKDVNSKSLSKSDGADAKEINRFAQQVRSRRNEVQKLQAAKKSSSSARRIALGGWNRRTTPRYDLPVRSIQICRSYPVKFFFSQFMTCMRNYRNRK